MLALPFANSAHTISVVNGSFESGLLGWAVYGDVSVQDSNFGIDATDGNNFAVLTTIGQAEPAVYGVPLSGTFALPDDELPTLGLASADLIAFIDALLSQYDYTTFPAASTHRSALAVDNLKVTDVPEPVSIALMSAGLLGIAAARRKRSDSRT